MIVVKIYSEKFFAMMTDIENPRYASIWCKNETNSLMRKHPVVNFTGLVEFTGYLTVILNSLHRPLTLIRESWKNPKRGTITERIFRENQEHSIASFVYVSLLRIFRKSCSVTVPKIAFIFNQRGISPFILVYDILNKHSLTDTQLTHYLQLTLGSFKILWWK